VVEALEQLHAPARAREIGRRDQAVVPATDDDDVDAVLARAAPVQLR
jgi:hypothetical protein